MFKNRRRFSTRERVSASVTAVYLASVLVLASGAEHVVSHAEVEVAILESPLAVAQPDDRHAGHQQAMGRFVRLVRLVTPSTDTTVSCIIYKFF